MRCDEWRGRGLALDQRPVMYGMAVRGRRQSAGDLGHYEIDRERVGDLLPGLYWPTEREGLREVGSWRWGAWPCAVHETGVLPARDSDYAADTTYRARPVSELIGDGREPAIGEHVWVAAGSDTESEQPCVLDTSLISHWRGPRVAVHSSRVHDIGLDGRIALWAGLDTAMAVIASASVADDTASSVPGQMQLAWPVGQLAGDRADYGGACMCGHGSHVSYVGHEAGGPLRSLLGGYLGAARCGTLPAGPMGLDTASLWSDGSRVGPLAFATVGTLGVDHQIPTRVRMWYDAATSHTWRDPTGREHTGSGVWRWWTTCQFQPATTGDDSGMDGSDDSGDDAWRRANCVTSSPAVSSTAIAAPAIVGIPATSPGARWVGEGGVRPPRDLPPQVWSLTTVARHMVRSPVDRRIWTGVDRGRYAPPSGAASGGAAFAPARRDADPDVLSADVAAAQGAADCHLAAVAGAGLAVCAQIHPTTGRVVSGMRMRRESDGQVVISAVNAAGDDDPGEPGITIDAFTTLAAGFNVPVLVTDENVQLDRSHYVVCVDTSPGARVVALPSAAECTRMVVVRKLGTGPSLQVQAAGGDDIDGAASVTVPDDRAASLVSDGCTSWYALRST
jgi:hypothetical protein